MIGGLRSPVPGHLQFVSDEAEQGYLQDVAFARALQVSRYAVAPRCTVTTHDGRTLRAGERVRLADFAMAELRSRMGQVTLIPPWAQLERLVAEGLVLERDDLDEERAESGPGPEAA